MNQYQLIMKKFALLLFTLNITFLFAQKEISGFVIDNAGMPLSGVNIIEKGTNNNVSSDINGAYLITVKEGATLVFSYFGFSKQEYETTESTLNVVFSEGDGQSASNVIITGTRTAPRSNTTTALPIDVLSSSEITSTGQITFDKVLQYKIPSFNTVQTPVNDATSLLDPYEIRNMGPSRTLLLVNGKRKNLSALLYVQTSPGQGETGADLSAIPIDAIERRPRNRSPLGGRAPAARASSWAPARPGWPATSRAAGRARPPARPASCRSPRSGWPRQSPR